MKHEELQTIMAETKEASPDIEKVEYLQSELTTAKLLTSKQSQNTPKSYQYQI